MDIDELMKRNQRVSPEPRCANKRSADDRHGRDNTDNDVDVHGSHRNKLRKRSVVRIRGLRSRCVLLAVNGARHKAITSIVQDDTISGR